MSCHNGTMCHVWSELIVLQEYAAGLSWREENDLKKALYASLQEPKRSLDDPGSEHDGNGLQSGYKEEDGGKRRERRNNSRSWPPLFVDESSQESSKSGVSSENSTDPKG